MADKIGVLGEATVATAATTTAYTVASAKAAKCQIFYMIQGHADATTDLSIAVNGITVMSHSNITASNFLFSSPAALKEGPLAALPPGVDNDTTASPAPAIYYLSAGDTVTYTITGSTAISMNLQVTGVEIDV